MEQPLITNVVTTAKLNQPVDIKKFVKFGWGIYDNEIYGGICGYVKTPDMKGKVTVFSNGKMISLGAKDVEESINQLNHAKYYLVKENLCTNIRLIPRTHNIVALLTLSKISFNKVLFKLTEGSYNPDNFPGIIIKSIPNVTCLMFSSGKIILTGAKSEEELIIASEQIQEIIHKSIK